MVVCVAGSRAIRFPNLGQLHVPTLVHGLAAPLGAFNRSTDGRVIDEDEDRIGVRAREDAHGNPARIIDAVLERNVRPAPISHDLLTRHRLTIHHQFHQDVSRGPDAGSVDIPVGRLV